jgi:hypothetical protein
MKNVARYLLLSATVLCTALNCFAQETIENPPRQWSIVFGLGQPIVSGGFNAEIVYWTKNFVFDYSHGISLNMPGIGESKDQRLAFRLPHSIGFGAGYRITEALNVRLEPKVHIWDVYYENTPKEAQYRISTYNTYTLGLGAYYNWMPFEKEQNLLRGLTIAPSFRWWPNVFTTLPDNVLRYRNSITEREEVHRAMNIGLAGTTFFVNVSIGYTF